MNNTVNRIDSDLKSELELIVILGPTASGKTAFAAHLAAALNGEVLSADSRQVYRGMTIGTGKDYDDYKVGDITIPCHLIDLADPGDTYNVYQYQRDFYAAFNSIREEKKMPVLCGGSGMYLEAVMKAYQLVEVPPDHGYRAMLETKTDNELIELLTRMGELHNTTDTTSRKRLIRAIEIARYYQTHSIRKAEYPALKYKVLGVRFDRQSERKRITMRLQQRLEEGMVEEVKTLIDKYGSKTMEFYGLEYKYISWYLAGKLSYDEMFAKLNTAIHQFAKRQMTWFRRMQRNGINIHWIDGYTPMEGKIRQAIDYLNRED